MQAFWENNGTEEIGLVTPTPELFFTSFFRIISLPLLQLYVLPQHQWHNPEEYGYMNPIIMI